MTEDTNTDGKMGWTKRMVHRSTGLVFYYHFDADGNYTGLYCDTAERDTVEE